MSAARFSSRITLSVRIPFSSLAQAASSAIPKQLALKGQGRVECVDIPFVNGGSFSLGPPPKVTAPSVGTRKECADYTWNATVVPIGDTSFSRSGDALRIEQSLKITGQAGLSGDVAKTLSLSAASRSVCLASPARTCAAVPSISISRNA